MGALVADEVVFCLDGVGMGSGIQRRDDGLYRRLSNHVTVV